MVKTVASTRAAGLSDFIVQRISAILIASYVIFLAIFALITPTFSFEIWQALFSHWSMKIFTMLVFGGLVWHAWIGMWTIFTDYVQGAILRNSLCVLVYLLLAAYFIWGAAILWSV